MSRVHQRGYLFLQHLHHAVRLVRHLAAPEPLAQLIDEFGGGLQSHISADQRGLDIVDGVVVQAGVAGDHIGHRLPRLRQSLFYFVEKFAQHENVCFQFITLQRCRVDQKTHYF